MPAHVQAQWDDSRQLMLTWGVTVAVTVEGRIARQTLGQLKINIKTPNINPKTFVPEPLGTWEIDPNLAARAGTPT